MLSCTIKDMGVSRETRHVIHTHLLQHLINRWKNDDIDSQEKRAYKYNLTPSRGVGWGGGLCNITLWAQLSELMLRKEQKKIEEGKVSTNESI